jgi:hypothetical protein
MMYILRENIYRFIVFEIIDIETLVMTICLHEILNKIKYYNVHKLYSSELIIKQCISNNKHKKREGNTFLIDNICRRLGIGIFIKIILITYN